MANAREILDRMKSIQDTMKITNAMYMISSSKLKKAKASLDETEPYFYSMQMAIGRILRHVPDMKSDLKLHISFTTLRKILLSAERVILQKRFWKNI